MNYANEYNLWLTNVKESEKSELLSIKNNEEEIRDRFYTSLEFGTAGLRGVLGLGLNRMNSYIVARATQGLSNQLKKSNPDKTDLKVVIAYDSRNKSEEFARTSASVLAANGIKALIFEELKPVPLLSFAVRLKQADAGIVITASHNPAKYNGYKVYGSDGAQLAPELAKIVLSEIENLPIFGGAKTIDFEDGLKNGMIEFMGDKEEDLYLDEVEKQCLNPDLIKNLGSTMNFVYTPLHGSGLVPLTKVFKRVGFDNVLVVEEQKSPDGNFPTVKFPNPEYKESFELALNLAKENDADLIIGTDPDADRCGIMIRSTDGSYISLTGNQTGLLLTEYILETLKERDNLPKDAFVVKTIVTTNIIKDICAFYNIEMKEVLTGFKFIGEKIKEAEESGAGTFIFGFEESYGYLKGTYARDKDAVVASLLIAEMALYYREKGLSLFDQLLNIYKKYGFYKEFVVSENFEGIEGAQKIKKIMENLRHNPSKEFGDKKVLAVRDYKTSLRTNLENGKKEEIYLPKSDVLYFELENNNNFVVRPSGTEPKIKLYCLLSGKDEAEVLKIEEHFKKDIENIVK